MSPAAANSAAWRTAASSVCALRTGAAPPICDSILAAASPMVYTCFTRAAMQRLQLAVVAVLVPAAEDEVNVGRKRLQRLDRRIHVGGLGIVVVLHAAQRGHVLQAMLHGAKILDRAANRRRLHSGGHADGDGGQHVLHVVRALQRNLGERHDLHHFLFRYASRYTIAPSFTNAPRSTSCLRLNHNTCGFNSLWRVGA